MPDKWAEMRKARLAREAAEREAAAAQQQQMSVTEEQMRDMIRQALQLQKGDPGPKGDRGDRGERGEDGEHGRDGKDGKDGRDGIDGKNGLNGRDGLPGLPGLKGDKGDPGISIHTVRSEFRRDASGQRIEAVVEFLSDGSERTLTVQRDAAGRPVGLI